MLYSLPKLFVGVGVVGVPEESWHVDPEAFDFDATGAWTGPDGTVYRENVRIFDDLRAGLRLAKDRGELAVLLLDGQRFGWIVDVNEVEDPANVLCAADLISLPGTVGVGYWNVATDDATDHTEIGGVRYACVTSNASPIGSHLVIVH